MHLKNKAFKILTSFLVMFIFIFAMATAKVMSMPYNIKVSGSKDSLISLENRSLKSNFIYKLNLEDKSKAVYENKKNGMDISVKLFGIIPVKKVTLSFMPEVKLIPGGQPIGVKLYTEGVLVVGFADVDTASGKRQSPASLSGLEVGDTIIEVNGVKIKSNKDVSEIINKNGAKAINVKLIRKGDYKNVKIKPMVTKNRNEYKIGLWIRDYTAGVGTLTFYDPASGKFGALGHPINDVDTGMLLSVRDGNIYDAKILSVEQGVKGKPGELRGMFSEEDVIGRLDKNTNSGIFGTMNNIQTRNIYNKPIPIARQNDIKEGPAVTLTSIEGCEVKAYDVYIEKLTVQGKPGSKSMIIRVTDKELLEKTGGIVQGMSGSPIIQNGKLIGAVTYVFVNRPDMGYGIYIEWMLDEAGVGI
jgi:stage IV sporulation protein B